MDANDFLEQGRDAERWRSFSRSIRLSADVLWDRWREAMMDAVVEVSNVTPEAEAKLEEASGFLASAQMLYGLALETAFKASILSQYPETVEILVTTDGRGGVTGAEMKQIGVPLSKGHDLVALGTKAEAFERGPDAVFTVDSDFAALKAILGHLTDMVVWMARYPVPRRSCEEFEPPEGVPAVAYGHYIRDWIDRIDLANSGNEFILALGERLQEVLDVTPTFLIPHEDEFKVRYAEEQLASYRQTVYLIGEFPVCSEPFRFVPPFAFIVKSMILIAVLSWAPVNRLS